VSWFDGELPEPGDPGDEKVLADIRRFGWHCVRVDPRAHPEHGEPNRTGTLADDVSFAYTIGVWLSLQHPEIILVGPWSAWHGILAGVVDLIKDGRRFIAGEQTDDVLDEYPVRFGAVTGKHRRKLLTFADWASQRHGFEAIQLILPDDKSRFPDDAAYASFDQPLLDR
jgi:hypothetical protein